jgi:hypothetical protein
MFGGIIIYGVRLVLISDSCFPGNLVFNAIDKTNSVALVRERTISTERPPLVNEVSANFCG